MNNAKKLDKQNVEDILPLTPLQEGMIFHYIYDPKSEQYFEQLSLNISGEINGEAIKKAWGFVAENNEILRTVYRWEKLEKPLQIILKNHEIPVRYYDLSQKVREERSIGLEEIRKQDKREGIDIAEAPFRVTLCKLEENRYEMIISNHHILYDGWSNGILLKEFLDAYHALLEGKAPEKPIKNKFREFVKWVEKQDKKAQEAYWRSYLQGIDTKTALPEAGRAIETEQSRKYTKVMPQKLVNSITNFTKENNITTAALLYSAWGLLLQKYNDAQDILFGTTVSGRTAKVPGIDRMAGLFINTLPLRVKCGDAETLWQLLSRTETMIREREAYESTPLLDIQSYSDISGSESLFDTIVVIENYPLDAMLKDGTGKVQLNGYQIHEATNYTLTVGIKVFDGIEIDFSYKESLTGQIEALADYFERILAQIIENPHKALSETEILSNEEKELQLCRFNSDEAEVFYNQTLHQLFEEQVAKNPNKKALIFEGLEMTYGELNRKANQLARRLRKEGAEKEHIIGIAAERSFEMIIAIMAVLKAGAAYLPIDPAYPKERIDHMLKDSKADMLLGQSHLKDKIDFQGTWLPLEEGGLYQGEGHDLDCISGPLDLAYIIYTSGSTGKPKGVMIEQGSVSNAIQWRRKEYGLTEKDNVLQLFSFSFDGFVTSFFTPILSGATVVLLNEEAAKNPVKIKQCIIEQEISHFICVPSLYAALLECMEPGEAKHLRSITLAGEKITRDIVERSLEKNKETEIINEYGPTENSVVSTILRNISLENYISIGKPIAGTYAYIVDKNNDLRPLGLPGELCLSGRGLARGYLNRPELTAERFIPNPFIQGERMYRTGDLAKWLPDGTIEFLGRADHQVKIRGFRIELGEIENHLQSHPNIKETAVHAEQDQRGEAYLCAYMTTHREITAAELRDYLAKGLPDYMIPSYFVFLDKMPLTPNGKIDRKALPKPERSIVAGADYEAPSSDTEVKLAEIWENILGAKGFGIKNSFFELGGHSLKAAALVARVHKHFNTEIPLKWLFDHPTIKEMADYIEKNKEETRYTAILGVEPKEFYTASSAQKRLFALQQFESDSIGYNISGGMLAEGDLDKERLEQVFKKLIERHESLRTSFEVHQEEVVQKIHPTVPFHISYTEGEVDDGQNILKDFVRPFDLQKAPLLRVGLVKLSKNKHLLLLDMHHIIADGTSMGLLIKEFIELYGDADLAPLKIQYKDYTAWQEKRLQSEAMDRHLQYWKEVFGDEIPVLDMAYDYPRPPVQSFEGDTLSFKAEAELTAKLKSLTANTGTTLYMVLLAAYNVLLSKYSGQEDIIIGSPIAGRHHGDLENIIGMFVGTLPMRNQPKGEKTFKGFLEEVKSNALKAYAHQEYPFDALVDRLELRRDASRNPLFDVMFAMQNMDMPEIRIKDLSFASYPFHNNVAKFDLTLYASEQRDNLEFQIEYSTKLYKTETVKRLAKHFIHILREAVTSPDRPLYQMELPDEEEKKQLIESIYETKADYPKEKTIHQLFEEQTARTPDKIALTFENKTMTYKALNEKANQLARTLREKGIKPDTPVGLMIERSFEMIIGLLGVLKAGGAYLPIDTQYPEERIRYMLKDSDAPVLLTQKHLIKKIPFDGEIIDVADEKLYGTRVENIEPINDSSNLIYMIYTSGSTGTPKGTMLEHRNLVNLLHFQSTQTNLDFTGKVLQFTTISFDVSFQEIFSTLLGGGTLYLISKEIRDDIWKLFAFIEEKQIETLFLPTAFLKFIMSEDEYIQKIPKSVKHIVTAGEQLVISEGFKKYLQAQNVYLHNHYGPSEAHAVTTLTIDPRGDIPEIPTIGKPIANTAIYIMDRYQKIQPIGVAGELYISGDCVGRGYLGRPELTAEKFLQDPFEPQRRMYRTGDLARRLSDGNIEFLGRIDHQIKIRGFRIEIGEIEAQLLSHPAVKEAAVIPGEDGKGGKHLIAYIVSHENLTLPELRAYLSRSLPEYMIPSYFVSMDKMPLTPNGKLDRKALPEPVGPIETGEEYQAPVNETEQKLAEIWSQVLKIEKIGTTDNFFELGGHSLKATVMLSKVRKTLDVEVPLKEIFKNPTIKAMGDYIKAMEKNQCAAIPKTTEKPYYPVSFAQKRIYTLSQFENGGITYNMPGVMRLYGKPEQERLQKAMYELIQRHESLRTSFEMTEGEIIQKIHKEIPFDITYIEGQLGEEDQIIKAFIRPFDLSKAPLLRVGFAKLTEDQYLLLFDMHHIISDGASMAVFIKEFMMLYQGSTLPELRIQYKDFAAWQNETFAEEGLKAQEDYWLNRFSDEIPLLNLPEDYPRPSVQSFEGDRILFELEESLTKQLDALTKETGATHYMLLLAAYTVLLSKCSGQEDIIVGSPIAARTHPDLDNIIGMFVNTLAMRSFPQSGKTFRSFLEEVKENALRAYENQDYQFEELVERLAMPRDLSRNPLFDVLFVMQNTDIPELEIQGMKLVPYTFENKISKFTMTLTARQMQGKIGLDLEYCTKIFKRDSMERMAGYFCNILRTIIDNPDICLADIEMISEEEKKQIVHTFNGTKTDYPKDSAIVPLFEEQAEMTPNKTALIYEAKSMTYKELNQKANSLAEILKESGVKPGQIVGIYAERSMEMVVGILSILKAGGACLPIDPDYPPERIQYMLKDCQINILLLSGTMTDKVLFEGQRIDLEDETLFKKDSPNPQHTARAEDLAYIMYTSGSTGTPKGVMMVQRSIVRLVKNTNYITFEENDRILQTGAVVFDASIFEIWGSLLNGLTLHLAPKEVILDIDRLSQYLKDNQITTLFLTTSLFNQMAQHNPEMFKPLKHLLTGGEAASPKHINEVKKHCKDIRVSNVYGPTENTTFSTYFPIEEAFWHNIPVGKPISNSTAYIVDKNNKLLPVGIPGELCVGGDGLAAGYLGKADLTAEKFIPNPFVPGERMYRTGDLARWLPDGNIEFLGRIDNQVKIRGFRIELGEIEVRLLEHPALKEAVVTVETESDGGKYLCAYIAGEKELTAAELKGHLSQTLPDYMIPAYFVQLDKLPLTPNGKVDKRALPKPEKCTELQENYEAPRDETEQKLAEIFSQVLDAAPIGRKDNFFNLGGHSIKAVQAINLIYKAFEVKISLQDFFKLATVEALQERLRDGQKTAYDEIQKLPEQAHYGLSHAQERLWIIHQLKPDSRAYNLPGRVTLHEKVEPAVIDRIFKELVQRHEAFRTRFGTIDGKAVQIVEPYVDFAVQVTDISDLDAESAALRREAIFEEEAAKLFNLETGPLLRVALVKVRAEAYDLIFSMHHIISDGTSLEILRREFYTLYESYKDGKEVALEPLKIQYKDFAAWQNRLLADTEKMRQAKDFWLAQLAGDIEPLELPTNAPRSSLKSRQSAAYRFVIPKDVKDRLKALAKAHQTSLFAVLLTGLNIFLSDLTGQEDVVVGTAGSGRENESLRHVIGYFINTTILRSQVDLEATFDDMIKEVDENTLKALEYQYYPLEWIVDELKISYPEISIFFNMLNMGQSDREILEDVEPYHTEKVQDAKFDMVCYVIEYSNGIEINCHYLSELFKASRIEYMMQQYGELLAAVSESPDAVLADCIG